MLQRVVTFSILCFKGLSYFQKPRFRSWGVVFSGGGFRVAKNFGAAMSAKLSGRDKRKKSPAHSGTRSLRDLRNFSMLKSRRNSRKDRLL